MVIITMAACTPHMDDNSLEAATVSDVYMEEQTEVTGTLAVAAGEAEGDWVLGIAEDSWDVHSPSHADLAELDGVEVTLLAIGEWTGFPSLTIRDADGPRFVSTVADDGTATFGRTVWTRGDVIGRGVVGHREGGQPARFTDVVVAADDGEVRLLPGEPTAGTIDGDTWNLTVISAYEAENPSHSKCGAPDILAVELYRTEALPGPALLRPADLRAPVGQCG